MIKFVPDYLCTYRWEKGGNDQMVIQVTENEIQTLKAEDHGDYFALTDKDTKEVSKLARIK
jgi:hypothetical protein